MKPFNLEAAKAGASVQTEHGDPARIICFNKKGDYPLIALVDLGSHEKLFYYNENGIAVGAPDLVMAPIKHEGWINIRNCLTIFGSKTEAKIYTPANFKVVKVEWEE